MINALLVDSCTLHTRTFNTNNEPTEADPVTLACKAEFKTKWVKGIEGEDVISSANIIIKNRTITHDDKVTLDGKKYPVKRIDKEKFWSYTFLRVYL